MRPSPTPLDHRDRAPLLASAAGSPPDALSGPLVNALAPAPPPIGSGATVGATPAVNLLAPGGNALAPASAPQQAPVAAMPLAMAPAAATAPPAVPGAATSPMSDAARQQLAQMVAARGMSSDDLAAAHQQALYGVQTLLPLAQQKAPLTIGAVATAISGAVKDGHLQPDAAGTLMGELPSDPGKLRAVVQQHLVGNIMAAIHLPTMTPSASSAASPAGPVAAPAAAFPAP